MKNNGLALAFAITLLLSAPSRLLALMDDFETTNVAAIATQFGPAPGAAIVTNAVNTNQFLRLTYDLVGSQNNRYAYDLVDTGAWENIVAEFDFRMFNTNDMAADGVSIMLMSTAIHGTNGTVGAGTSERPNVPGVLAMGIIPHNASTANDFSLHWDGVELLNQRVPLYNINIDDGIWHRAILEIEPAGNGAYARGYVITNSMDIPGPKTLIFESMVPGMQPFENRVQFAGRSGGRTMDLDIDNVSVSYANLATNVINTVTTNRTYQDFDQLGGTPFESRQQATDGTAGPHYRPGPVYRDDGDSRGTYARLSHDGVNTSRNAITLDEDGPSQTASFSTKFDFRATSAGSAADGWGILFIPTKRYGLSGNGPFNGNFEEPNLPHTLAFGFDMHPEGGGTNDVSVHWNNAEVAFRNLDPDTEFDLNNAVWNRAEITVEHVVSGAVVNLTIIPDIDVGTNEAVQALTDIFVPGVTNYEHRIQVGSRTGGAFHSFDIDNIVEGPGPRFGLNAGTEQAFEGGDTWFESWVREGSALRGTEILSDAESDGYFLRLLHANVGNTRNTLMFDHTAEGSFAETGEVTSGQFDFRILGGNTNDPADGVAFMLIPTNTYGITGPGAFQSVGIIQAEQPNYPGVFGIGIDIHQESTGVNDVNLHWNNARVANVRLDPNIIDLDTNVFHRLAFSIDWTSTGAWVNVDLTADILGTPGTPTNIIQQLVPDLLPYDYRVEFAGRTGGSTANIDLDNIVVNTTTSLADSDMDGLDDDWERANFTNLTTTAGSPGQDFDGDGFDDRAEFLAGTGPVDANSLLIMQGQQNNAGQFISWDSVNGKVYRVWRTDDPVNGVWTDLLSNINGTEPLNTLLDPAPLDARWYYRVELLQVVE